MHRDLWKALGTQTTPWALATAHSPASTRGPLKSSSSSSCPTLCMVALLEQRGGHQPWSSTAGCSGSLAAASAVTSV